MRMIRSYNLFANYYHSNCEMVNLDCPYCDILNFFQEFFNLKDWLINDEVLQKGVVEKFYYSTVELKLCGDIANGTKHLELTQRNPKIGQHSRMYNVINIEFTLNDDSCLDEQKHTIRPIIALEDGREFDAFNVATECKEKLAQFLKENNVRLEGE